MAWTTVETPNAKYVLIFSAHETVSEVPPHKFDALVIEGRTERTKAKEVAASQQYRDLVADAIKGKKPVWITDVGSTMTSTAVGFAKWFASVAVPATIGVVRGIKTVENAGEFTRREIIRNTAISVGLLLPLASYLSTGPLMTHGKQIERRYLWSAGAKTMEFWIGPGGLKIRNAISAEKVENFVAPRLRAKLDRKPVIAMVWGAFHYGITDLLKHPEKRAKILKEYKLDRWVKSDYPRSVRIHLNEEGKVVRVEEFKDTLRKGGKPAARPKPQAKKTSRRDFLATVLGRKRRR